MTLQANETYKSIIMKNREQSKEAAIKEKKYRPTSKNFNDNCSLTGLKLPNISLNEEHLVDKKRK